MQGRGAGQSAIRDILGPSRRIDISGSASEKWCSEEAMPYLRCVRAAAGRGTPVEEICRKTGISQATYYNWKRKYGGLMPSKALRPGRRRELVDTVRKKIRALTIVDAFSRLAPAVEPRFGFRGADVVDTFGRLYGLPKIICVDQGSAHGPP